MILEKNQKRIACNCREVGSFTHCQTPLVCDWETYSLSPKYIVNLCIGVVIGCTLKVIYRSKCEALNVFMLEKKSFRQNLGNFIGELLVWNDFNKTD